MVKYKIGEFVSTEWDGSATIVDYNYDNNTCLVEFSNKTRSWYAENNLSSILDLIDRNNLVKELEHFIITRNRLYKHDTLTRLEILSIINRCKGIK